MIKEEYSPYKIIHNFDKLIELKNGKQPNPLQVQIIPSNTCNNSCSFCFPPDTLVLTEDGYLPIQDIDGSLRVFDGEGKLQVVNDVFCREYKGELIKLKFSRLGCDFKATLDHPVFIKDKGYIPISEIKIGDKVKVPVINIPKISNIFLDDILSGMIKSDDGLVKYKDSKKWVINNIELNQDFGELCGYFLSEGHCSIIKNRPNSGNVVFTFAKDEKEYQNRVVFLIKKIFGVESQVSNSIKSSTQIVTGSKIICDFLLILFGTGSKIKQIHPALWGCSTDFFNGLWKGYLNGDGCFQDKSFSTTSLSLAFGLLNSAYKMGLSPNLYSSVMKISYIEGRRIKAEGNVYTVRFRGEDKSIYSKIIGEDPVKSSIGPWEEIERGDNCVYFRIKDKKREQYDGYVYNFSVENSETYIANSISVHNCSYRMKGSLSNEQFDQSSMLNYEKIIEILDDCVDMGIGACQYSLYGDEKIPIIKDNENFSVKIGNFVDDLFDCEFEGGYEEADISDKNIYSYAINDNGELIKDKITKIYRHFATEDLFEVTLKDGRLIRVTGSHSLNVIRNDKIEKIPVKELNEGDLIACSVWNGEEIKNRYYKEYINNVNKNIKKIKEVEDNKYLYRLLGYFVAEGSLHGSNDKNAIVFTFDKYDREEKIINDCLNCIIEVFGIEGKIVCYDNKTQIYVFSKKVRDLIERLFLNDYKSLHANGKSVPQNIWNSSNDNKIEFLTGLFLGDGNFRNTKTRGDSFRNSLHLKTSSFILANEVFILLNQIGCRSTIVNSYNKERIIEGRKLCKTRYFSVNISDRNSLEILNNIIWAMGKKLQYLDNKNSEGGQRIKREYDRFGDNSFAIPIKTIRIAKELGRPLVYDITVSNTHRFIGSNGIGVFNTGGGEVLMHPRHYDFFQETFDRNIELALVSNGMALKEKTCDLLGDASWVRISVDCATEKTYSSMRKVSEKIFSRTIRNIMDLVKYKRSVVLGVGFVVNKDNYKEIFEAAKMFKDIGVDNFRISAAFTPDGYSYFDNIFDESAYLAKMAQELSDENFTVFNLFNDRMKDMFDGVQDYGFCPTKDLLAYIGADYNVYTCCTLAYNKKGKIGSIKDQSFKELWLGEEKRNMFASHDPNKRCKNPCLYKAKNEFINYCIKDKPKHINFI